MNTIVYEALRIHWTIIRAAIGGAGNVAVFGQETQERSVCK